MFVKVLLIGKTILVFEAFRTKLRWLFVRLQSLFYTNSPIAASIPWQYSGPDIAQTLNMDVVSGIVAVRFSAYSVHSK